jgi:hypothetical protein
MMETCKFCETRKALKQAEKLLEETPTLNVDHYDNVISDLINSLGDAHSWFMCMCPDETDPAPTERDDAARYYGQADAV